MTEKLKAWKARQYYQTPRIKNRFMFNSEQREVVPRYKGGAYGKRPDKLSMEGDLDHFIQSNALEFHASVEHWKNPLMIDEVEDPNLLRTGWDLIIDIDCDESFTLAKYTAKLIAEKLEELEMRNVGVKFSGNRGFHLSIQKKAFPDQINGEHMSNLYPELPEKIITFLREELKENMKELVRKHGFEKQMQTQNRGEDPYQVSDIEQGWTSRHLFRMPYSLHSGSGLVSLPIQKKEILGFEKEQAKPDNVIPKNQFFVDTQENEAETLVQKVLEYEEENPDKFRDRSSYDNDTDFETPDEAVPEDKFPPTIKKILEGLDDGRKRGLFILIKFLQCTGWDWDAIRKGLHEWNQRNNPPLDDGKIDRMVSYHEKQDKELPPPNYDANGYYKDMGVYQGEDIPNPVSYIFKKKRESNTPDALQGECKVCGKICGKEEYLEKHMKNQHQQVYKS